MSITNEFLALHEGDEEDQSGLNILLKVIFLFVIWIVGLAFGLLPYFCKRCRTSARILGVANAFSGGIFLGIGLFHLLPESYEQIQDFYENDKDSPMRKLPISYFIAFAIYALILFVEKVAFDSHSLIEHDHEHGHGHGQEDEVHEHDHHHKEVHGTEGNKQAVKDVKEELLPKPESQKIPARHDSDSDSDSDVDEQTIKGVISTKGKLASFLYLRNSMVNKDSLACEVAPIKTSKSIHRASVILHNITKSFHAGGAACNEDMVFMVNPSNVHIDEDPNKVKSIQATEKPFVPKSNLTPYILMIALAFHGFFEGVAMGVQGEVQGTIFLAIAILSHKWAESFTLGISFTKANTIKKTFIWLIVIFSLFGPLGVSLGIILSQATNKLIEGIILAMSTGTFVYVAATEVIVEEFAITRYKYMKYIMFLIGGIFTAVLAIIEKLGEGHEH